MIGVPWRWLEDELPLSPPTRAAFDAALGSTRPRRRNPRGVAADVEGVRDAKKDISCLELFTIHGKDLRTRPELFGASLRYRIIAGGLVRAEEYVQAMRHAPCWRAPCKR